MAEHVVTVTFLVKPDRLADFISLVRRQAETSLRLEPACRRFDVCVGTADAARVFLYEIYDDEAAFRAHLETAHFRAFDAATRGLIASKGVETWSLDGSVR